MEGADNWLSRICRGKGQMWGNRACSAGPIPPHLETTPGIPRDPDNCHAMSRFIILNLAVGGQKWTLDANF
jgi:hypothetical protein